MVRYPIRCPNCRQVTMQPAEVVYDDTHIHDGIEYAFHIPNLPVVLCGNCGRTMHTDKTDARLSEAIRKAADLLSPSEIIRIREQAGWTIEKMAEAMGVHSETVKFWEASIMFPTRTENDELRRLSVFGGVAEANG